MVLVQLTLTSWSWTALFLVVLVATVSAYQATKHVVARRLKLARTVLRHIRKHKFENLEMATTRRGDELNDLIRQVHRTGQVVEKELEEMKRLESYRRDFIGNVSHELKTPIFAIRGFGETLLGGALEDEEVSQKFVQKIVRNADRLGTLAEDLSDISRLETGQRTMQIQPISLRRLVADVIESVESLAKNADVRISTSVSKSLPPVQGDALQLRQVLSNLVVNAIKYSNEGDKVRIKARTLKKKSIRISVVDTGIGIEKQNLDRLTERFFRVDKSRSRSAGGTGLGLSIVKHILAAHDQVLKVESKPGVGSTFSFELPLADLPG
ncbi:MAG: histidine kinase [Bacteroidetes Order II. Incertae sedis bacterium]|jgi:two-component system, OmpR family, phosphate regulon sensor histidine kinase PhoR|nr:histidine kinase [Bacteroidetes Order II. bacterium]